MSSTDSSDSSASSDSSVSSTSSTGSTDSGSSVSSTSSTGSTSSNNSASSESSTSSASNNDAAGSTSSTDSTDSTGSTSSTWSSNTSSSSSSFSLASSSSSSWSSESSQWDQAPWYSICHLPPPTLRGTVFTATVELDLRHSDSVILQTIGPLEIDIGGEWGDTVVASNLVRLIDGQKLTQTFRLLADAIAWQNEMWLRIKAVMFARRQAFLVSYSIDFDERYRLV